MYSILFYIAILGLVILALKKGVEVVLQLIFGIVICCSVVFIFALFLSLFTNQMPWPFTLPSQ